MIGYNRMMSVEELKTPSWNRFIGLHHGPPSCPSPTNVPMCHQSQHISTSWSEAPSPFVHKEGNQRSSQGVTDSAEGCEVLSDGTQNGQQLCIGNTCRVDHPRNVVTSQWTAEFCPSTIRKIYSSWKMRTKILKYIKIMCNVQCVISVNKLHALLSTS